MKAKAHFLLSILVISTFLVIPTMAHAVFLSPFIGQWQATDLDGSDIRLTIAGPPAGPFQITWTESYFGFCGRESGIVRGIGWLAEGDPYLLEANLHLRCFTTGETLDFDVEWRYDSLTDTIAYPNPEPVIMTWYRPGTPRPPAEFQIIAHPDEDWVEGMGFEAGTLVSLRIFDEEGALLYGDVVEAAYPDWEPDIVRTNFMVGYDMQAGDHLWMTDGRTAKDLIIADLAVTGVDQFAQTVSGIAAPGSAVIIEYPPDLLFVVTTDPEGVWTASLEGLAPGQWGLASQEDSDHDLTRVAFYRPNPRFSVFPEWESVEGWEWPLDAVVHLTIDDPGTEESPDYGQDETVVLAPWDPNQTWVTFNFAGMYDAKLGDVVTLDDGTTIRTHTVQNLAVTAVDEDADTVAGTADAGAEVNVWPHATGEQVVTTAGGDGTWQVDFSDMYNLGPGDGGRAEIRDGMGNGTAVDWYIPNPRFTVFPEWEWFDGMDWPDGATVSISVTGKPECSLTTVSWGGFFNGGFPEGCDVAAGDLVTFDDGTTIREHTIRNLAITNVDKIENTVAGEADPGTVVHVWVHEAEGALQPTSGEDGTWLVDFDDIGLDLVENMGGRAQIYDDTGNATAVDWHIPNPHFSVFPEWESVEGWEWPLDAVVHLTINDPGTEASPDYGQDETVVLAPWDPNQTWVTFNFAGMYDAKLGDVVTLDDGTTIRTHTVQNLAVTAVDEDADTVAGTADAYAEVNVWPHATGEQIPTTADAEGAWQVDFSGAFDLVPSECGRAEIRDNAYNGTAVDWCALPPARILVQITDDWFLGQYFTPNAEQTFWLYESQGGTKLMNGTMQADDQGTAFAWVGDQYELAPGNYLVVSDGVTTKELVLEDLTFDVFDPARGFLQGTAPPPAGRTVWVGIGWEDDAWSMEVSTDPDGNWSADFAMPVADDYLWVAAQVFDLDGDVSEVRPSPRSLSAGNFHVAWSQTNPEEVIYLSWSGSGNLTNVWAHEYCPDDLEFFGNSWVTENEGEPTFFQSLVGWGTTGAWSQDGPTIDIGSESSGCPGPTGIPIHTTYQFFDDELRANLIAVQRVFEFGGDLYPHDVRPFIPRLYPADGFTQVLHPDVSGLNLVTSTTAGCDFGCKVENWNGTWFAIHDPATGTGMIVQHAPSAYPVALWVDNDGGSFTNSSSVLLLQPEGGFVGAVTETEYLCFYDSSIWEPSLALPSGCQP